MRRVKRVGDKWYRQRSWRERLLSRPWRPWHRWADAFWYWIGEGNVADYYDPANWLHGDHAPMHGSITILRGKMACENNPWALNTLAVVGGEASIQIGTLTSQ